ncbi:MAG: protein kinase [Scytonema hyalinum WJT4-NPBG1]|nr:protein kinase [Scytonema hyalinum WJT4-NPBG1]
MLVGQILRQRYKIVRLLGSGSFGVTYLAEDLDLPDHPVCVVKNLKQNQNPEYLQLARGLFDREAKVLYHLGNECSQIPRLFAHFEENSEFYLVQQFIDGHDLSEEIFPGKKWSEAQVIQLLQEVLELLTFIHNKNIIHRDIKPQNLMRRKTDGKIVLIDFGAVKQISGLVVNAQGQTNVSIIVGTSGYMPSEQLNGFPKLSSDVYAVGMLGIYALTGIKPQELPRDSGSCEVFWRNLALVSPRLANVLDKMVRYHFNERYQTASEALQALTPLSRSTFISPSPPSPPQSLLTSILQQVGANQKVLIGAGVGAGVLLGVGLLFLSFWRQPTPDSGQATYDSGQVKPGSIQPTPDSGQTTDDSGQVKPDATQPTPDSGQTTYDSGQVKPDSIQPTLADVQSACPDIPLPPLPPLPPLLPLPPLPPLPSKPDWENNQNKYYGFAKYNPTTGRGIMIYPDRNGEYVRYDGEVKNDKLSGCGILTYANKSRYIGQFENHTLQGKGIYIDNKGCVYIGLFKKHFEGPGTWISKDGKRWRSRDGKVNNNTFSCE